jgi:hypothetical protein
MPIVYKFSPGDKVVYTNEYGVCWGVKTIVSRGECGLRRKNYTLRAGYTYEGSATPWCPVDEKHLRLATEEDLMHADWWFGSELYFQQKYGRDTTKEEYASLLWSDPFEGEP